MKKTDTIDERLDRERAEEEARLAELHKKAADAFWANANKVSPGMASLMRALESMAKEPK